jgi:hypothetical protein
MNDNHIEEMIKIIHEVNCPFKCDNCPSNITQKECVDRWNERYAEEAYFRGY